jgi:hypothetical protein
VFEWDGAVTVGQTVALELKESEIDFLRNEDVGKEKQRWQL